METPDLERLTIVERAQLLHDATLRRHSEMLDRHEVRMAALADLATRQQRTMEMLTTLVTQMQQTLDAIKDMLDRGNGH